MGVSEGLIQFKLEKLNEENKAFLFERLATDLIHRRICPNILPATGPVGGGDKGIDAQTYETFITDDSNVFRFYVSPPSVSEKTIFAFSIRTDVKTKIVSDVKSILKNVRDVQKIKYFTNQSIKTTIREDFKKEIRDKFNIDIEIFDQNWFLLQLKDKDYDLAIKYLECPVIEDPQIIRSIEVLKEMISEGITEEDAWKINQIETNLNRPLLYTGNEKLRIKDYIDLGRIYKKYEAHLEKAKQIFLKANREALELGEIELIIESYYSWFHLLFKQLKDYNTILKNFPQFVDYIFQGGIKYYEKLEIWIKFLIYVFSDSKTYLDILKQIKTRLKTIQAKTENLIDRANIGSLYLTLKLIDCRKNIGLREEFLQELSEFVDFVLKIRFYDIDRISLFVSFLPFQHHPLYEDIFNKIENFQTKRRGTFEKAYLRKNRSYVYFQNGDYLSAIYQATIAFYYWLDSNTERGSILVGIFNSLCYQNLKLYEAAEFELLSLIYRFFKENNPNNDLLVKSMETLSDLNALQGKYISAMIFGIFHITSERQDETITIIDVDNGLTDFEKRFKDNFLTLLPRLFLNDKRIHDFLLELVNKYLPGLIDYEAYVKTFISSNEEFEEWISDVDEGGRKKIEELRKRFLNGEYSELEPPINNELNENQKNEFKLESLDIKFRIEYSNNAQEFLLAKTLTSFLQRFLVLSEKFLTALTFAEDQVTIRLSFINNVQEFDIREVPSNEQLILEVLYSEVIANQINDFPFKKIIESGFNLVLKIIAAISIDPENKLAEVFQKLKDDGFFERFIQPLIPHGYLFKKILHPYYPLGGI